MITPRFRLSQDDNTVSIFIRAPYCNLRELDVSVEDNEYIFVCKPYYLRLNLPGSIIVNEDTKSSFNSDDGEFTFVYEKVNHGEEFKNLDFITTLLCPKIEVNDGNRKIEILSTDTADEMQTQNVLPEKKLYGFAMRGGYQFNLISEFNEVFEIDPHKIELEERRKLRIQDEKEKFCEEHYLGDYYNDVEIDELYKLENPWEKNEETMSFSPKELDFLKDLTNVEYNLTMEQIQYCHNSLLDILFAYCYDRRTTYWEGTCESGWTISKISSSLCWFEGFKTAKEALITAFRRSLIYPLYREFKLSQYILNDLKIILKLGEKAIIKCLIEIHDIFLGGDCGRYILNNLFIKDYIIYVMKWDKDLWLKTVEKVNHITIEKEDLGLNLIQLEALLHDDLLEGLQNLKINKDALDSDDYSDSDTEETSESDDEDDSSS